MGKQVIYHITSKNANANLNPQMHAVLGQKLQLTQNIPFSDNAKEITPLTDTGESDGSSQATVNSSSTQGISNFEFNIE